jgi:hypothetical protein
MSIPKKEIIKRETEANGARGFKSCDKKKALERQASCCIYCGVDLNSFVWNKNKSRYEKVKIHYDHFVPYAFVHDSRGCNIVASCSVCNGLKSDFHFQSIEEARVYIMNKRNE